MTDHEDRFAASLDALSRGEPPASDDDLTHFVSEARSSWSNPAADPPGTPPRLSATDRRQLWSAIQQEAAVTSAATHEGSNVMSATSPNVHAPVRPPSGWGTTIVRWQPVLSMAVMFAILAGLVGIAYIGLDRQHPEPESIMLAALQDTPEPVRPCEPYGPPVQTSSELRDVSLADWPVPRYSPLVRADPAIGQRAVEVYESWLCFVARNGQDISAAPWPVELQQFQTERFQYVSMLKWNPEFRSDELASILDYPLAEELLTNGVLPLNRPEMEINYRTIGMSVPAFGPGDVYHLSDGRYGVIMGTITTEQLVASQQMTPIDPDTAPVGALLTFLAFDEVDGWLLIDEIVDFCVAPGMDDDSSACQ